MPSGAQWGQVTYPSGCLGHPAAQRKIMQLTCQGPGAGVQRLEVLGLWKVTREISLSCMWPAMVLSHGVATLFRVAWVFCCRKEGSESLPGLNAHARSLGPHGLLAVCTCQSQTAFRNTDALMPPCLVASHTLCSQGF